MIGGSCLLVVSAMDRKFKERNVHGRKPYLAPSSIQSHLRLSDLGRLNLNLSFFLDLTRKRQAIETADMLDITTLGVNIFTIFQLTGRWEGQTKIVNCNVQ